MQGFFITLQADHADFGGGNQIEHAVEHAQTGAQNRHHGEGFAFDALAFDVAAPAVENIVFGFEIAAGFISHQARQLFGQSAEFVGARFGFAHQGELVFDQRVVDDGDVHNQSFGGRVQTACEIKYRRYYISFAACL